MSSRLLIDSEPLIVLRPLAREVGICEAVILQQLHYWLSNPKVEGVIIDGEKYIYNTIDQWTEQIGIWSRATIKRAFEALIRDGYVVTASNPADPWDRCKAYRIVYEAIDALQERMNEGPPAPKMRRPVGEKVANRLGQNEPMALGQNEPLPLGQNEPMFKGTKTTTETTVETTDRQTDARVCTVGATVAASSSVGRSPQQRQYAPSKTQQVEAILAEHPEWREPLERAFVGASSRSLIKSRTAWELGVLLRWQEGDGTPRPEPEPLPPPPAPLTPSQQRYAQIEADVDLTLAEIWAKRAGIDWREGMSVAEVLEAMEAQGGQASHALLGGTR